MFVKSAAAVLLQGLLASAALAQGSPAPIGYWVTDPASEALLIQADGSCSLQTIGGGPAYGTCGWDASYDGGILTMMNQTTYQAAPIYFNVIWIDQRTIRVEGDIFHRQG